jgi:hypothetical protein
MSEGRSPIEVVSCSESRFRPDFPQWLKDNPHVYREFEKRALQVARFRSHYSARTIAETMRHDTAIRELGSEYKINGNYVPCMARLFALCNPNHAELFEYREHKAAA